MDTTSTQICDLSPFWLGTVTSIKKWQGYLKWNEFYRGAHTETISIQNV